MHTLHSIESILHIIYIQKIVTDLDVNICFLHSVASISLRRMAFL